LAVIDGKLSAELGHEIGGTRVKPDVAALLEVQADDLKTYGIEDRLSALAPRLAALEKERLRAVDATTGVQKAVEADEARLREVQDRLRQHRELLDKSEKLLGQVSAPREAAAAMAQIEQAKRFIADEERDVDGIGQRLTELRKDVIAKDAAVKDIEKLQQETRATLDADRSALDAELKGVLKDRAKKATAVPTALMQKYDRIRQRRRSEAVFKLRGNSCAHCDVDIPVQRRSTMKSTGATEMCEGCGVLLFVDE
jgi:predicted  nucleic acid-binding Zn-ribbon protein